jgi:tRNA(Ile)-lysidine synthase
VEVLCADLGIPCSVVSIAPGKIERTAKRQGIGLEAAARLYRHRAWNAEALRVGAAKVLVAHTRDDLLETTLMRILRGSGPGGLAAMPRSRGRIQRPLLDQSRAEVLAYLEARGIPYRTDSTNADPQFLRNRIRHKLIPCLDEFFPGWRKTLLDLAETQRMTADFLAAEAGARIPWTSGPGNWSVSQECFFSQPPILREEALFAVLDTGPGIGERLGAKPPRRRTLRLFTGERVRSLDLGFAILRRDAERVSLGLPQARDLWSQESGFSLLIKGPGVYKLKGLIIRVLPAETVHPTDITGFFAGLPLVLRRIYPEDCIFRGGRKRRGTERARETGCFASSLITAEDAEGSAAFIGYSRDGFRIVLAREDTERENHLFFSIQNERG